MLFNGGFTQLAWLWMNKIVYLPNTKGDASSKLLVLSCFYLSQRVSTGNSRDDRPGPDRREGERWGFGAIDAPKVPWSSLPWWSAKSSKYGGLLAGPSAKHGAGIPWYTYITGWCKCWANVGKYWCAYSIYGGLAGKIHGKSAATPRSRRAPWRRRGWSRGQWRQNAGFSHGLTDINWWFYHGLTMVLASSNLDHFANVFIRFFDIHTIAPFFFGYRNCIEDQGEGLTENIEENT